MSNEKHEIEASQSKIIADLVKKEVAAHQAENTAKIIKLQQELDKLRGRVDVIATNVRS